MKFSFGANIHISHKSHFVFLEVVNNCDFVSSCLSVQTQVRKKLFFYTKIKILKASVNVTDALCIFALVTQKSIVVLSVFVYNIVIFRGNILRSLTECYVDVY